MNFVLLTNNKLNRKNSTGGLGAWKKDKFDSQLLKAAEKEEFYQQFSIRRGGNLQSCRLTEELEDSACIVQNRQFIIEEKRNSTDNLNWIGVLQIICSKRG